MSGLLPLAAQDTLYLSKEQDTLRSAAGAERYVVIQRDHADTTLVLVREYLTDGTLIREGRRRGKGGTMEGEWRWWNKDGQQARRTTFANGKWNGTFQTWWPNGQTRRDDLYEAGELVRGAWRDSLGREQEWMPFEQMPRFPGGDEKLFAYLREHLRYPKKARSNGETGQVLVQFVVDQQGAVQRAEIKKSVSPLLDEEALRVVMAMPNWEPGRLDGQPVKVAYAIPIRFTIR
ncbi:MAG: energy transducer TonB [Flavobacteriales bacterium]|nr:energy transducer TonB [Flavobacteriales bacterium]